MSCGPARPIKMSFGAPRPDPAHEVFIKCAAARPGASIRYRMGRGPAQPIAFSKLDSPVHEISNMSARPGLAYDTGGEAHETRVVYGPIRHFRGPARGFNDPGHGQAHVLSRTTRTTGWFKHIVPKIFSTQFQRRCCRYPLKFLTRVLRTYEPLSTHYRSFFLIRQMFFCTRSIFLGYLGDTYVDPKFTT